MYTRIVGVFIPDQQSTVIPNAPLGLNFVGDRGVPDTLYPTDYNDWSRVLLRIPPETGSGRTAIRGGFGIYYNVGDWAPAYFTAQQQPYGQVVDMVPASLADPVCWHNESISLLPLTPPNSHIQVPCRPYLLRFQIQSGQPYVQTWSLGRAAPVKGVACGGELRW